MAKETKLVRMSPATLKKLDEVSKLLAAVYTRDGAVVNAHFIKSASIDSLIYVALCEAERNLKRASK